MAITFEGPRGLEWPHPRLPGQLRVGQRVPVGPLEELWRVHVCASGNQHKAQKENWLVSGLQDHRYLSDTKMPADRPPTSVAVVVQWHVVDHRQAAATGPVSQLWSSQTAGKTATSSPGA